MKTFVPLKRRKKNMFNKGDFFFKVGMKSGYHHINILDEYQKKRENFLFLLDGGRCDQILYVHSACLWISKCTICVYKSGESVDQTLEKDGH